MKTFTRIALSLLLAATTLLSQAATVTITVVDSQFQPRNVTATTADQILFNFTGASAHPVASDNNSWSTFTLTSARRTHMMNLTTPGAYAYHCTLHGAPGGIGMAGSITVTQAVGLSEEMTRLASQLTAFPNPASRQGEVVVSFGQVSSHDYKIKLSNIIGRTVREVVLPRESGERRVPIDLSELPAGVYFYSLVINDKMVETRRLVVQ